MASAYPGGLDSFTNPVSTDLTNSVTVPHATQHADLNDAVEAIQAELGVAPSGASATLVARLGAATEAEFGYVAGVTSAIQTQLNAKAPSTSPTLVTPNIGVATATSVNKVTVTAPATTATLTLAEGSSLITAGAYATTLTATATTGVTLPTSGTLATLAGSEAFTNKTLTAPAINSPVIVETVTNAITAHVGSSQGDGAITTKYARVTTSANPDDAVTLPAAVAGKMMVVNNSAAANAIDVFPATNGYINALAQNAAFNLAANKTAAFFCMVDGTWVSILTA